MKISFNIGFTIERGNDGILTRESWQRRREQVRKRDKVVCQYCGGYAPNGEVDHVVPLSRDGTDALKNLAWACKSCNASKGQKTLAEWRASRRASRPPEVRLPQPPTYTYRQVGDEDGEVEL